MRVLVAGYFGERSGHGRYCRAFADALAGAGADVVRFERPELPRGGLVRILPLRKLDRGARAIASAFAAARCLRTARCDVVHFQLVTPIVDRFWLPRALAGCAAVMTVHNVEPHTRSLEHGPAAVRPILRAMSRLVVHTEANRARLEALHPELAGRVRVVPHGVWEPGSRPARDDARRALGIPADDTMVLFFGALRANKGLDLLLRAVAALRAAGDPRPPRVVVAGALPAGASFAPIARLARELGVTDRLDARVGFVPEREVDAYYAAADVVALPYQPSFQAQSGVLVDAYAHAIPVVATEVAGLGETLRADGTGLAVPPGDPQALAAALRRLCDDRSGRAAMASRMRALAAGAYAWPRVAERTIAVYRELVGEAAA